MLYFAAKEMDYMTTPAGVHMPTLYRKRQLHVILPVFFVSVIAFLDRVNIAYAGMTMTQDLPWLTPEIFGAGAGMFFIGYFFFEIPGALLAAKFDASKWIARIMFTWGLVCGLLAFVQTPMQFYIVRFLLGVCEASLYPVVYAVLFPRWFTPSERAAAISLMLTSLPVSNIIGAPLAGILLELSIFGLHGWQSLFILEALPAVVFTFIFLFWVKDWPEKAPWLTAAEKQYLADAYEKDIQAMEKIKKYSLAQVFTEKKVWLLCLIYFCQALGFWGFNFWMPQVLKAQSGWSTSLIGGAIALPMILSLIAQVLWGAHASKTGEKRWHIALPLFISAIGLAAAPFVTNPYASLLLITLTAAGIYAQLGIWWTVPTTFLHGAAVAGASAMINSIANLGGYVGPYMLGWIKMTSGTYDLGYFILSGALVLSGALMFTLHHSMVRPAGSSQEKEMT